MKARRLLRRWRWYAAGYQRQWNQINLLHCLAIWACECVSVRERARISFTSITHFLESFNCGYVLVHGIGHTMQYFGLFYWAAVYKWIKHRAYACRTFDVRVNAEHNWMGENGRTWVYDNDNAFKWDVLANKFEYADIWLSASPTQLDNFIGFDSTKANTYNKIVNHSLLLVRRTLRQQIHERTIRSVQFIVLGKPASTREEFNRKLNCYAMLTMTLRTKSIFPAENLISFLFSYKLCRHV